MCFYTRGSRIRIATKDIVCYKSVQRYNHYCISLHQEFKYEYNKIYSNKLKWILFLSWLFDYNITCEAYHSYASPHHIYNVKCIIPKGSLYLVNEASNEYCSTSIIIKN